MKNRYDTPPNPSFNIDNFRVEIIEKYPTSYEGKHYYLALAKVKVLATSPTRPDKEGYRGFIYSNNTNNMHQSTDVFNTKTETLLDGQAKIKKSDKEYEEKITKAKKDYEDHIKSQNN